ncbi:MAG: ATP-binding cassette domain-containing protein [Paludibacter sp.]|nr:ATP-binding cassette domain-containing protein [Paludibacter sp.]
MMETSQEASINKDQLQSDNKNVIIDINNLEVAFGTLSILKDVTLKLYEGENLVILGKSGSGKSVLIKCIVALLNSTGGRIEVFGENVNKLDRHGLSEMRKKIGFLFQSGALYDSMTVKQNLQFVLQRIKRKLKQKEIDEQIIEVLENVGLANAIDKMPSELSGGMRKRISLARTIIVNPSIMIFD